MSRYISTSSGGAKQAAQRMGASRGSGARLLGFLSDVSSRGIGAALRALNFEGLAGRPIDEVFLGLADYICPDGGTIDEGIARDAFIEMIADVAESGITDLDQITAEQMQTVFELFATHAIEARLCNDIGTKTITLPADAREASLVQEQLQDFIRRGVSDALAALRDGFKALTPDRVLGFVDEVYEQAFGILQSLGDMEADRA
ncbi:MAG: Qat anti-phage system associated protein QatB [Thermodesulfobacteriota bacterium]